MSDLIIAGILIGIIVSISFLLIYIDKHSKRKRMNHLTNRFSELGSRYQVNFTSQAILKDEILGIDGVQRKLLILNTTDKNEMPHELIDLDELRHCSVKKSYGSINNGDLKNKKLEQYLEKIVLCFEFHMKKPAIEVSFYNHLKNHLYEISELEQKAKDWESFLSKMLHNTPRKIIA